MLFYVLLAIAVFGLLIFTHELGHFLVAKACGIRVNEFSLCMGPALWQKTVGETTYSLRLIPIGGYCAMEGEDEKSDDPRAFSSAAVYKRLLVLIAGAGANLLCGFLILLVLFSSQPRAGTAKITSFYEGSTVAKETGLRENDTFYRIDGWRVYGFDDVQLLLDRGGSRHEIEVLRNGRRLSLGNVQLARKPFSEDGKTVERYGMRFAVEEMTFPRAVKESFFAAADFFQMVRMSLSDLLHGIIGIRELSGTVGIVRVMAQVGDSAESVRAGVRSVAYFAAFLAVSLAATNLLPIPALDGGKVFTLAVTWLLERLLRRKIDRKYEQTIHAAGMLLLLGFMAFITIKDIWSIFR